jgi:hypothetical protein
MFPRPEHISDFIRYALHAHLRVLIVRRDFEGRDHVVLLRLELLLHPAVEEQRYVRISLFLPMYDISCPIGAEGGTTKEDRERQREWGDRPAMWACLMPFLESHLARTLVMG